MTDTIPAQPDSDVGHGLDALLARLTLEQKVRLLTGADFWSLHDEPAVGLRTVVVSDGPSGVRGAVWDERDPSLNLPSATALGATWDPDLAYRYGAAMAREAARKGVDVVLGPTINLHRSPLGGRHFEAYSEDPYLTGAIAQAFVRGLQANGVGACPKHFVANDFETERFTASVEVSERALRELYLAPFERAVVDGQAWTVMSAYNAVGGVTMTENALLDSPLRDEWGFDGVVISDWTAVRSLAAAKVGQDLAMPGPDGPWGPALVAAVRAGEVAESLIDDKVRRILVLAGRVGALEGVPAAVARPRSRHDARAGVALAREVEARGIVLVRNQGDLLPLAGPARIAVIGQSADLARTQGGGSATVVPESVVSPLQGIQEAFPDAQVIYALGAIVHDGVLPFDLSSVRHPETGEPGVQVKFVGADGATVLEETRRATDLVWLGNAPTAGASTFELVTDFTPPAFGRIEVGIAALGRTRLEVDGEVLFDVDLQDQGPDLGAALLAPPTRTVPLEVGPGAHRLRFVHQLAARGPMPGGDLVGVLGFTAGWRPVAVSPDGLIAQAAAVAREADVAVVVVGTNERVESEGYDRTDLALPGRQDDLVRAVAAANPRTVVVVNSGSPVVMGWRDDVAAVLLTWFGGQEYGHALADVLAGAAEPGGRLPTTWPATEQDVPVIDVTPVDGVLRYAEGIHIGYRAWHKAGVRPAYPFGFGLGYTTWGYQDMRVADLADGAVQVSVDVTNTGGRAGREVVQVYLSRPASAVDRPVRWLAGSAVVEADAGTAVTAEITVRPRAFEHWDEEAHSWTCEPGDFDVIVARHANTSDLTGTVTRP